MVRRQIGTEIYGRVNRTLESHRLLIIKVMSHEQLALIDSEILAGNLNLSIARIEIVSVVRLRRVPTVLERSELGFHNSAAENKTLLMVIKMPDLLTWCDLVLGKETFVIVVHPRTAKRRLEWPHTILCHSCITIEGRSTCRSRSAEHSCEITLLP